jgi:hypothetical protein
MHLFQPRTNRHPAGGNEGWGSVERPRHKAHRTGPMRALLKPQSLRPFDMDNGVGETRRVEGGKGLGGHWETLGTAVVGMPWDGLT